MRNLRFSGAMNGWDVGSWEMSRNGAVTTDWTYTISVLEGETIEYKYVKGGSWAQEALMNYSNPKAANQSKYGCTTGEGGNEKVIVVNQGDGKMLVENEVRSRLKVSYAILFFVWLFLAVYRYVGYEGGIIIGGNDAPTYIDYFQTCLAGKGNNIYFVRTEPLFQIMTKAVRTITSNYHVYFALIYGLIIFSYLRFIDEFDLLQSSKTPLFMLVFPFIQSFCAIRTHITIALILLAIVALKNRRNILMWGLLIASVFIQRASLIYAIFPIFYFYYKKNKMTVKKAIAFVIIGCAVGYIGKKVIIGGSIGYLTGGVYANYASASSSAGYLFDYIKLIVEQVIIDGYMILSYKKVNGQLQEMEKLEKEKLRMLQMMCYFDFMLIPICYILGIWRGASYFFLPRLLILGYIISDFSMKISKNSRKVYYMIVKVVMPIWLVLRLFTVYDVSGLMPYYLDFRL